ncbi:hypothetical protein ACFV0T_21875 [Streptomyces sp. NPDC059582]|uniref:hypothetical protein n=1 Tax=Streptomyces sp. NPDC059582 TaxID=3346875 RepID=UPI0036B31E95
MSSPVPRVVRRSREAAVGAGGSGITRAWVDGGAQIRLRFDHAPARPLSAVSAHAEDPPVRQAADDFALLASGRGPSVVDTPSEEWGRSLRPPVSRTVRVESPARSLT